MVAWVWALAVAFSWAPSGTMVGGCDVNQFRSAYQTACDDYRNPTTVESYLEEMTAAVATCGETPLAQGYQAAAGMMSAGLPWNPIEALARFNEWKPVLEACIERAPTDPDLRLLRLGVQTNVPAIVGYRGEIEGDLALIQNALQNGHWKRNPAFESFVAETVSSLAP